ncbi:MAG: TIGR00730 family Rossman fold protein [Pseudomonadota bacterium]|nr:TIGR00730 family Rossman fold protein [Pseudomonadota bacterium]
MFCGSQNGNDNQVLRSAQELGSMLSRSGVGAICGGSGCGLMKVLIESIFQSGGHVLGVHPKMLDIDQPAHPQLSNLITTDSLHERKNIMIDKADAFLVMPGSFGTLDEFFEVMVLNKINQINKPIFLFNINGFWDGLITQLDAIQKNGFVSDFSSFFRVVKSISEIEESLLKLNELVI